MSLEVLPLYLLLPPVSRGKGANGTTGTWHLSTLCCLRSVWLKALNGTATIMGNLFVPSLFIIKKCIRTLLKKRSTLPPSMSSLNNDKDFSNSVLFLKLKWNMKQLIHTEFPNWDFGSNIAAKPWAINPTLCNIHQKTGISYISPWYKGNKWSFVQRCT